jgi:hypothetical protein
LLIGGLLFCAEAQGAGEALVVADEVGERVDAGGLQSSCRSLGVSRAMVYLSEFARGGPALDASVDFGNAGFSSVFWMT